MRETTRPREVFEISVIVVDEQGRTFSGRREFPTVASARMAYIDAIGDPLHYVEAEVDGVRQAVVAIHRRRWYPPKDGRAAWRSHAVELESEAV